MFGLGGLFGDDPDDEFMMGSGGASSTTTTTTRSASGRPRVSRPHDYDRRPAHGMAGLLNQGATCYLNSLIQIMYLTPELRKGLYALTPEMLHIPPKTENATLSKTESSLPDGTPAPEAPPANMEDKDMEKEQEREKEKEDTASIQSFLDMGFEEPIIRAALKKFNKESDSGKVLDYLLSGDYDIIEDDDDIMPASLMDDAPAEKIITNEDTRKTSSPSEPAPHTPTQTSDAAPQTPSPTPTPVLTSNTPTPTQDNTPPSSSTAPQAVPSTPAKKPRLIPYQMQRLFASLQYTNSRAVSTSDLTASFGWYGSEAGQQHDVHELNRLLIDAIEMSLRATPGENLVPTIFRGRLANKIICSACGRVSAREENFMDLPIVVNGYDALEKSMANMVQMEELSGDNAYYCEACEGKVTARKGMCLSQLPEVLTLPLQRFEYDWARERRIKIYSRMSFPMQLDMAPYLDPTLGDTQGPIMYDLFAVVIHSGGAYGGHYHAYIRDVMGEGKEVPVEEAPKDTPTPAPEDKKESNSDTPAPAANKDDISTEEGAKGKEKKEGGEDASAPEDTDFPPSPLDDGWFDFNDSSVTPIKASAIRGMYGGKNECAYMLLYRRSSSSSSSSPPSSSEGNAPHPRIIDEIMEQNNSVDTQRDEYDRAMNMIKLNVSVPGHYGLVDGMLVALEDPKQDGAEEGETDSTTHKTIEIDQRATGYELQETIADMFGLQGEILLQEMYTRIGKPHLAQPLAPDASLRSAGLRDGAKVLAWDGQAEHIVASQHSPPITVRIAVYQTPTEGAKVQSTTITVTLPENSPFSRLKKLTAERMESSGLMSPVPGPLLMCRLGYKDITPLRGDDVAISSLDLHNDSCCTAEVDPGVAPDVSSSLAMRDWQRQRDMIELWVINGFSTDEEGARRQPIRVRVDREVTVLELKKEVIALLPPVSETQQASSVDYSRLRKALVGGSPGVVLPDEEAKVCNSGLQEGQLLLLEEGPPPGGAMIAVRFIAVLCGDPFPMREISVSKMTPLSQCKQMMLDLVKPTMKSTNGQPLSFRLRTTDFFELPEKVLCEEEATLDAAGVRDDDLLWLEPGRIPPKGFFSLRFQLYGDGMGMSAAAWSKPAIQASKAAPPPEATEENPVVSAFSPSHLPWGISVHLSPHYTGMPWDAFWITHLTDLEVEQNTTLGQIKDMLWKACPDVAMFIDTLNDELEGKTDEEQARIRASHLRLWCKDRMLSGENVNLKRLYINSDSTITVQVLPRRADPAEADPASLLVFAQRRNLMGGYFEAPVEVVYSGTTIKGLRQSVCTSLNLPASCRVAVAKYIAHDKKNPWRILEDEKEEQPATTTAPVETPTEPEAAKPPAKGGKGKGKGKGKGQGQGQQGGRDLARGLKGKPYNFKDGDTLGIVVLDAQGLPYTEREQQEADKYFESACALAAAQLAAAPNPKERASRASRPRLPEAVLRINLDLD